MDRPSFISPTKLNACRYLTVIQDGYLEVNKYPTQVMDIDLCQGDYRSFAIPADNDASGARYDPESQEYYVFHSTSLANPSLPVSIYSVRERKLEAGPSLRRISPSGDVCVYRLKEKEAWWISRGELMLSYDCTGALFRFATFDWSSKTWISTGL